MNSTIPDQKLQKLDVVRLLSNVFNEENGLVFPTGQRGTVRELHDNGRMLLVEFGGWKNVFIWILSTKLELSWRKPE